MKQKLLLKSMLLLFALIAGSSNVWAATVTRTENFASSKASNNTYACGSQATTSGMQDDWDYAWTPANSVYVFQSGIRLGKSSGTPNTGTVTNTTMLSGISTGTSVTIKVYAAVWNTDGGSLVVTYNGSSETKAPSNSKITDTSVEYSASAFSTSTNFSITKAEGVTSFSIASSNKRILIDKVEVVYDDASPNELAWSATSKSVTYNDPPYDYELPTLSNPHSLAVTYESTNESVATVALDGTVTIKNVTGSTTISAHTDGNATYAAGTVSYTLTVTRKFVIEDGVFDFSMGGETTYGSGISPTTDGGYYDTDPSTWTAVNVTMVVSGKYRLWQSTGPTYTLRYYGDCSSAFSVPTGYVITKIVSAGGNFSECSSGTLSGNTWTGAAQNVTLSTTANTTFSKFTVTYTTANQSITPAKEYTTLTSAYNLDFTSVSSDLKAYIATSVSDNKVQMTQVNKVPAGTGLVLKATTPGSAVNVPVFDGTGANDVDGNKLVGCTTETPLSANSNHYVLVYNGGTAEFQCLDTYGATIPAGKAYLDLTGVSLAPAPTLNIVFENETSGIDEARSQKEEVKGAYFNLAGQRVAQPTKGLYIVNGRKVLIK